MTSAVRLRLVPSNPRVLALLGEAGRNVAAAGDLMHAAFATFPANRAHASALRDAEREGDRITRELLVLLESTFVSPIDREDAFALASALDDVVDHLEEAVDELQLYGVRSVPETAVQQASIARDACHLLSDAVGRLDGLRDARDVIAAVRRAENAGDALVRVAIGALFGGDADPLVVIRWKDIHEEIEAAVNACERAVEILESIYLKTR